MPEAPPTRRAAAILAFTGRIVPASFRAFAEHRARLLGLQADVIESAPDRIVFAVAGQTGFVDAFEMACSLGPIDCLVLEIGREDSGTDRERVT